MDNLWLQAQFITPDLKVMLTNATGSELGDQLVNVRTGRIEAAFKREDVTIQFDGDMNLLLSGNLPYIELSQSEAEDLLTLLGIKITMLDE